MHWRLNKWFDNLFCYVHTIWLKASASVNKKKVFLFIYKHVNSDKLQPFVYFIYWFLRSLNKLTWLLSIGRLRRLSHNPKALQVLFCFVVRAEKAAGIKPKKYSLAEAQSVLYVNKHQVSRLNSSLYAVIPTILALPCQSITGTLSRDWILMAYTARTNSKKYT